MIINDLWEAEDSLQNAGVFVNQRGQKCHSDSYNTLVNFAALANWQKNHSVSKEVLNYMTGINQQPPMRIVAAMIKNANLAGLI